MVLLLAATSIQAQDQLAEVFPVAVSANASEVLQVRKGQLEGSAAPLYRCVFERTELPFSFTQLPLARALFNFQHGEAAVVVPLAQSEERDRFGAFAGPLIQVEYLVLSPREITSFKSLQGMIYVLPRGHLGKQFVEDFVPGGFEVNSWEQVFDILRLGRADFTIVPRVLLADLVEGSLDDYYTILAGTAPSSLYVANAYLGTGVYQQLRQSVAACRQRFAQEIQQRQGGDQAPSADAGPR